MRARSKGEQGRCSGQPAGPPLEEGWGVRQDFLRRPRLAGGGVCWPVKGRVSWLKEQRCGGPHEDTQQVMGVASAWLWGVVRSVAGEVVSGQMWKTHK